LHSYIVRAYIHTYHTYICIHMYMHTHTHIHTYIHANILTHINTHTKVIHTHIHAPAGGGTVSLRAEKCGGVAGAAGCAAAVGGPVDFCSLHNTCKHTHPHSHTRSINTHTQQTKPSACHAQPHPCTAYTFTQMRTSIHNVHTHFLCLHTNVHSIQTRTHSLHSHITMCTYILAESLLKTRTQLAQDRLALRLPVLPNASHMYAMRVACMCA